MQSLTENFCPPWPCPTCKRGVFTLHPKALIAKETIESQRAQHHPEWDPDWTSYVFTAWAQCNNPACKEECAIGGTGGLEPEYDEDGGFSFSTYYTPKFCSPMPEIIEIPEKCPNEVKRELRAGFSLFWADRGAAANRVRIALERLLDYLGIPNQETKGTRIVELTLHKRIESFATKEPTMALHLMALKWLGNTGSHEGKVAKNDLLDAFEVLEHVLVEMIDRRTERVSAIAEKLTKKHGPKKKPTGPTPKK